MRALCFPLRLLSRILLATSLVIVAAGSSAANASPPAAPVDAGYQAYRSADWALAAQIFGREVAQNYSNSRARYYLGDCYFRLGQHNAARKEFILCISLNNDAAVVSCCRSALTRMYAADEAQLAALTAAQANQQPVPVNPYAGPDADLLNNQNQNTRFDAFDMRWPEREGYLEPEEPMDDLLALARIPAYPGLGAIKNVYGARLDKEYLEKRGPIVEKYFARLNTVRNDAIAQVEQINRKATSDQKLVHKWSGRGAASTENYDYQNQIDRIAADARVQIAEINRQCKEAAAEVVADAKRDICPLDDSHASIVEQVTAHGGISKMTSVGTGMYVRNFVHMGGDDSELAPPEFIPAKSQKFDLPPREAPKDKAGVWR